MRQKQGKERLEIEQQSAAGSIRFAKAQIKQGQLYRKDDGKNQQLVNLFLLDMKRTTGDSGPKEYRNRGIPKRSPAVVKTPSPERLILMATALAPKRVQRQRVKTAAGNERSWLLDASAFIIAFLKITLRFIRQPIEKAQREKIEMFPLCLGALVAIFLFRFIHVK